MITPDAHDLVKNQRGPLEWYIEICAVCGCQLGPGVGSRTRSGRCVVESHRSRGGIVVLVQALPLEQQEEISRRYLTEISEPIKMSPL